MKVGFIGGPLDGKVLEIDGLRPCFRAPVYEPQSVLEWPPLLPTQTTKTVTYQTVLFVGTSHLIGFRLYSIESAPSVQDGLRLMRKVIEAMIDTEEIRQSRAYFRQLAGLPAG